VDNILCVRLDAKVIIECTVRQEGRTECDIRWHVSSALRDT